MKKILTTIFFFTLFLYSQEVSTVSAETFIPENTTCKSITTDYVNVLPYNGKTPGITRACIGWTPNFPSTRVEGGQGTYFYFAYKLFPTPMPAYEVGTDDDLGLYQHFTLSEPIDTLGACSMKTNDEKCRLYEPFLYYPARWESRFGSNSALSDFKGPYTVGPHEFYHYRYRGRLVPQQVTFHYDVVDMENNRSRIPLAFGDIVYDVPEDCYYTDVIDIKDECRMIQFYIPVSDTATRSLPEDAAEEELPEDRIRFYNPGEHTLRVEVDEKQMYLYQSDEGEEWQGKDIVYREKWNDEIVTVTPPDAPLTKKITIYRYDEGTKENGRWCVGHDTCWKPENVYMPAIPTIAYNYNKDGYVGPLYEVQQSMKYVPSPADRTNPGFKDRTIDSGLDGRPGYAYFNRGVFQLKDGSLHKSNWQAQYTDGNENFNKQFYIGPSGSTYLGYEWQRYQIVSGTVTKGAAPTPAPETTPTGKYAEYFQGPVSTHTTKTLASGEIQWVNQDEFKNHCYSEEDAFSNFGEWNKSPSQFNEKDSPAIVCHHNHSDDFHYWKFDWSPIKKFGGDVFKGLIF